MLKKVPFLIALYICSSFVGVSLASDSASALCSAPTGSFGQASQTIQVDPGKYNVWVRMMAPDLTNNAVYMQVDDNICSIKVGDTQISPLTWVWVNHVNGDRAQLNQVDIAALTSTTPNVHTIKFFGVERGVKIDKVILLSDLTCVPTGDGSDCINQIDRTAPSVPSGLAVTSKTDNSVSLKWNASTDNTAVKGYTLYRNSQAVSTSTTTTFTNTGLTPLTNYTYEVAAFDEAGNTSARSASIAVQTNASQDTTAPSVTLTQPAKDATVSGTALKVAATASDNVGVQSVDFYVGTSLIASDTTAPYEVSYNTTWLRDGSYYFTATAKDLAGNATTTSPTFVTVDNVPDADTTAPSKVSGLVKTEAAYDHVSLSWAAATDNVAVKNYDVIRDGSVVGVASGTSFTDNLVAGSTVYTYTVRARDTADNIGASSDPLSVSVPAVPDTTPPAVVLTQPAAAGTYSGTLAIAANATDNKAIKQVDFFVNGLLITTDTTAPYTATYDTKQLPNTTATVMAKAYDSALNSASTSVSITVSNVVPDTTAPTVPTGLMAQAASPYQANISWQASTDNVGVVGYNIYRNGQKITSTSTLSYGDTSLSAASTYSYTVQAYDAAGNVSAQSAVASVTTPPLFQNYVLYGNTTDTSGISLKSVRASVTSNGVRYSTTSDRKGAYILSGIPVSAFTAEYSARKYATQQHALTVPSGQSKLLKNIMMNRL